MKNIIYSLLLIIAVLSLVKTIVFIKKKNKYEQQIEQQHLIIKGYHYLLQEKERQNDTLRWFNQMKIKY